MRSDLSWDNEILAKPGTNCFENLVITCGQRFTPHIWERTCACILEIFRSTLPETLMTWRHDAKSSGTAATNDVSLSDRTDRSFDYSIVGSASSQHNRMVQAGNTANLNSSISDQQGLNISNRLSSPTNSIERSKTQSDFHIFQILTIKCIIQLELIQTIDDIVFFPSALNVSSDQQVLTYFANFDDFRDDHGIYNNMGLDQLLLLVDCVIESHMFARAFNSNHAQRNLLRNAGYRGKAKPNLLTQVTHSIACAFRIIFRMFCDPKRSDSMDTFKRRILKFRISPTKPFSALWNLKKGFVAEGSYSGHTFKYFLGDMYLIVAETVVFDLKPELRYTLREFLLCVGRVFNMTSELTGSN
ncbi:unnamed protein product [Rotaria socialis]|uniref:Sec7/BIG1-like C-terminal domain-containing protein n=2 Tax=Rotaria socialis TaxID=392032 RepID=A0A821CNA3_9BILA|nr:unnamed protein product [Rotaria socialis]CAF4608305.1 unnamed protein product [Rotaria socialis]